MTDLIHPRVVRAIQTCYACPDQWRGELDDGRDFYFRYRSGYASVGVGPTSEEAVDDWHTQGKDVGGRLQGVFDSDEQRNEVFGALLDARLSIAEEMS